MLPENGSAPATKNDLAKLESVLKSDISKLEGALNTKFDAKIDALDKKIDTVDKRLDFKFETKFDALNKKVDHAVAEILKKFDDTMSKKDGIEIKNQLDRVVKTLDSFVGTFKDNERTLLVFDKILGDHRGRLDGHDKRLTNIEARP